MQSLTWYMYRLRRMSAAELCYRAVQMGRAHAARWTRTTPAPPARLVDGATYVHVDPGVNVEPYLQRAERIISGRYTIFDLDDCVLGSPPEWNRDPLTGRLAPLSHASTLDYRDERIVGNIKYLWEPSRHLHLPALAQAYALTGEARYGETLRAHIDSWIEQCPPERGAHWTSSLELAIRLINWSIAWQLIGGSSSPLFAASGGAAFRERWLQSVYLQTRAITRKLSRFSSANNHLIGETAGVWIAALTWRGWPQMQRWGERCKRILEHEMLAQNAPDGGNREQAFSYQQFVLDFGLLAGLAARAAGRDFSRAYWERIEAMIDFIASMMDAAGNVPMIGDADDGYVVQLSPVHCSGTAASRDIAPLVSQSQNSALETPDNYRSLLATGAVLFDRADLARKARVFDDKSGWLLGASARARFERLLDEAPDCYTGRRAFEHVGYYLLGDGFETSDEVRMLVDAGPLGYLSIAAHGHADALSFVLSIGGEEVLIDPGTYAYHTAPQWRRYFRSTRAHNTVLIDDRDQSDQSGNFMWSRHARARCLAFLDELPVQRFVGEHDGYRRLEDPVTHRREIQYDARLRQFTILDSFHCRGPHTARWHWHCAEALQPVLLDKEIHLHTARHRIRIVAERAPRRMLSFFGGGPQEGGWVSRRFGCKVPAATIAWESTFNGPSTFRTYIWVDSESTPYP